MDTLVSVESLLQLETSSFGMCLKKKKKTVLVTNRNHARAVKQTFIKMREFAPSS